MIRARPRLRLRRWRLHIGSVRDWVPEGEALMIHWHIWEPGLTENEISLLVTFLGALTDEGFMPEIPASLPSGLTVTRAANSCLLYTSDAADE